MKKAISDAFRYETGVELTERINSDQNCDATIKPIIREEILADKSKQTLDAIRRIALNYYCEPEILSEL